MQRPKIISAFLLLASLGASLLLAQYHGPADQPASLVPNTVRMGGVFNSTLPSYAAGELGDLQIDSSGRLILAPQATDPCQSGTVAKSSVAISATADAQLVALTAGQSVYVCGFTLQSTAGTAPTARLIYGTGTVCATGTTGLTGVFGFTNNADSVTAGWGSTVAATAASNALCIDVGGTTPTIVGVLTYVKQ